MNIRILHSSPAAHTHTIAGRKSNENFTNDYIVFKIRLEKINYFQKTAPYILNEESKYSIVIYSYLEIVLKHRIYHSVLL